MSGFPELVYEDRKEDRLGLGPNAMSIDLLRAVTEKLIDPITSQDQMCCGGITS